MNTKAPLLLGLLALTSACAQKEAAPPPVEAAPEPAATPAPEAPATAFRFSIGEFKAVALKDGGLTMPNDAKTLAINKTPDDVSKLLTEAGLPTETFSLSIQPLLVQTGDRVLLFDTGAGKNMGPGAGELAANLKAAGLAADSVTDIFISHAHGDHVGGLLAEDGTSLAFPNATVHLSENEWKSLQGMKEQAALVAAITPKVTAFKPGSDLVPGVKAVDIKGHTPGHSGYLIGSGNDTVLYVGDTVHHSIVSVQQPDWTIAFDGDAPTAQKSRKEQLEKNAAAGQRIYAVHFPYPGLGKFEKRGDRIVWVPET